MRHHYIVAAAVVLLFCVTIAGAAGVSSCGVQRSSCAHATIVVPSNNASKRDTCTNEQRALPTVGTVRELGAVLEERNARVGACVGSERAIDAVELLSEWSSCQRMFVTMPIDSPSPQPFGDISEFTIHAMHRLSRHAVRNVANIVNVNATQLCRTIPNESLDFAFVGGNRDAEAVMTDVHAIWSKLRVGGVLAGSGFGGPLEYLHGKWVRSKGDDGVMSRVRKFAADHKAQLLVMYQEKPMPGWYLQKIADNDKATGAATRFPPIVVMDRRERLGEVADRDGATVGLEIGVWEAAFAEVVLGKWKSCASYTCIDPWNHDESEVYVDGANVDQKWHDTNLRNAQQRLEKFGSVPKFVKKTSLDAVNDVSNLSVDVIYIDGRHDYKAVLADAIAYWPKLREGGVLAGHDYISQGELTLIEGPYQDWSLSLDNTSNPRCGKGAVQDFASAMNVEYMVTWEDPAIPSWYMRKGVDKQVPRWLRCNAAMKGSDEWKQCGGGDDDNVRFISDAKERDLCNAASDGGTSCDVDLSPTSSAAAHQADAVGRCHDGKDGQTSPFTDALLLAPRNGMRYELQRDLPSRSVHLWAGVAGAASMQVDLTISVDGIIQIRDTIQSIGELHVESMQLSVGSHTVEATACPTGDVSPASIVCRTSTAVFEIERSNENAAADSQTGNDGIDINSSTLVFACTWSGTRVELDQEHIAALLDTLEGGGVHDDNVEWVTDGAETLSGYPLLERILDTRVDYLCAAAAAQAMLGRPDATAAIVIPPRGERKLKSVQQLLDSLHGRLGVQWESRQRQQQLSAGMRLPPGVDILCTGTCGFMDGHPFVLSRRASEALVQSTVSLQSAGMDELAVQVKAWGLRKQSANIS